MSENVRVLKRSDWVELTRWPEMTGTVTRVSFANGWADVDWGPWAGMLRKRVPIVRLKILHTIPCGAGTVTDVGRKEELS